MSNAIELTARQTQIIEYLQTEWLRYRGFNYNGNAATGFIYSSELEELAEMGVPGIVVVHPKTASMWATLQINLTADIMSALPDYPKTTRYRVVIKNVGDGRFGKYTETQYALTKDTVAAIVSSVLTDKNYTVGSIEVVKVS